MNEERESAPLKQYALFTAQDDQNNRIITFAATGLIIAWNLNKETEEYDPSGEVDLNLMSNFHRVHEFIKNLSYSKYHKFGGK